MALRLSRPQKIAYIERARAVLDDFDENISFAEHLSHVLDTYGRLTDMTRARAGLVLGRLPVHFDDRLLNAFVGRQALIDTENVMTDRVVRDRNIQDSVWDIGLEDDPAFDSELAKKARREDRRSRRVWGASLGIASDDEIAASANDGEQPLFKEPPPRRIIVPQRPMQLLTDHIVAQCRDAMAPLTRTLLCANSVRSTMMSRISRLQKLASELAVSDEDEMQCL